MKQMWSINHNKYLINWDQKHMSETLYDDVC